ncbi:MAG: hypothetical protein ABSD77_09655 [Verrucomicrobiota bacterium]|jgi:hypothetical protein
MDTEQFKCLQFQPDAKLWSQHASWTIFALTGIVAAVAVCRGETRMDARAIR